ncbi:MAG: hypothetical protein NC341_10855 [Blautia sp.]|nr:hypothetical protein [Blautia sp.]MCM1200340.1 hypothetical protein [Bacteroides fragilis]
MEEPKQNTSRPMKGEHGNIKGLSSANSAASLFLKTACHVMTRPLNLAVYGITWFRLYSLCQFGGIYKNAPVLFVCFLWWLGVLGYGLRLWIKYDRHKIPMLFRRLAADGNMLTAAAGAATGKVETAARETETEVKETEVGQAEKTFAGDTIKWYIRRKDYCQLFLKDGAVLLLDLRGMRREETDFLDVKLSAVPILRKKGFKIAAGLFLAAATLYGSCLVARSAIPYQGELSWYLKDLQDKRIVALRHNNVYETGIEGILEDIRKEVELPERLCLATSFNLHFAPDGMIQSFDTMLYGFDKKGDFVDSYLISYPAGYSRKINVWLHGSAGAGYNANKDLQPLVEAVSAMPLEETAAGWDGESCYGILYYGTREWFSREGICYLNHAGECRMPSDGEDYFSGYSVSVFCPENKAVTPVRYLYMGYQLFPEEEAEYTADYYPEEDTGYGADYFPAEGDGYGEDYALEKDLACSVHSTENIWRGCEDYPLGQYGEIRQKEGDYYDKNGEKIYHYRYQNFHMKDELPGADSVNRFLEEKERTVREAWQSQGQWHGENETIEEDYGRTEYGSNHPSDYMEFQCMTYLEGSYCSLVFFEEHYTGGVKAFPSLCTYTVDVNTGKEAQLQQIVPQISREGWIALIDGAFEKEQGFKFLLPNTEYEETAGECWYDSYEKGEWESGFYLTKQGIAFYYGFGQIAWEGEGLIEALVPWEEIYQRMKD